MELDEETPSEDAAIEKSRVNGPWIGEVRQVVGRGSDDTKGLPPVHSITITRPDDEDVTLGSVQGDETDHLRVLVLGVPEARNFGMCPICGSTEPLTREHVPQHDLGGAVTTNTCKPCNSGLGSRVENELKQWFDDAIFDVKFSGGDVPGKRKAPRILLRTTADGQVGMIFDKGRTDPHLDAILSSDTAEIHYRIPNPTVWRVAALKHAYLASCLALGEIPDTPLAAHVRGVLVATRDGKRGTLPPETGLTTGLRVARSHLPARGPTVLLVALMDVEGQPADYGLSLAGTLFVSWPLDAQLFWKAVRRLAQPALI